MPDYGAGRRKPSGADAVYLPLGPAPSEDESDHLDRVAAELAAGSVARVRRLQARLKEGTVEKRKEAAAELGMLGGRQAISSLRELLDGPEPGSWEIAVHGLRQSRERDGWLCLESVALGCVQGLESDAQDAARAAGLRLLMMGRTKTMDRLFRAADGHSRSISQEAARRFIRLAVTSIPAEHARVMSLRLGIADGHSRTPPEAAAATGLPVERVRALEAEAWAIIQSPRTWQALKDLTRTSA